MRMVLSGILLGVCRQEPLPIGPYDGLSPRYFSHRADVQCAAIPPDSPILVSLDATGTITGWNRRNGRRLYSRPALLVSDLPQRMTCSPDGKWVAFSARSLPSTVVRVCSVATGEEARRFDRCFAPAFSPDGMFLAGSDGSRLRRWSMKSGAELPGLPESNVDLRWVAYSPDGKRIAASQLGGGMILLWDLESRTMELRGRVGWGPEVTSLCFTPDGKDITIGTPWGIEGYATPDDIAEPPGGPPLYYSRDGKRLVAGYRNKRVSILSSTWKEWMFEEQLPFASPGFLEVSCDADILLRVQGSMIRLEPIVDRTQAVTPLPGVTSVVSLPGGLALMGDVRGTVVQWDLAARRERKRITIPDAEIHSFSWDGRRALIFQQEKPLRIWDLEADREAARIDTLRLPTVAALSPDGASLAVGLATGTVVLWDVAAGKERVRIPVEVAASALAWSGDGSTVAWGDAHGGIGMADSRDGGQRVQRTSRGEAIVAMALTSKGRWLGTGDRRGDIRLWTADLSREPDLIRKSRTATYVLSCSPDGRWMAAVEGTRIVLISLDGRERSLEFEGHRQEITSVGFAPDSGSFLSADRDGSVLLWRVPPRK